MRGLIIPAALLVAALAFGASGEAQADTGPKDGKPDRPPLPEIPVPTSDDDLELIDQKVCEAADDLGPNATAPQIQMRVAEELHPDVAWPAYVEYDHPTAIANWTYFGERAASYVAASDKQAWCADQPNGLGTIADVLNEILVAPGSSPMPGRLYQIQKGDNFVDIVRDALNSVVPGVATGNSNTARQARLDYIYCVTSGPRWNMPLYSTQNDTSSTFPSFYTVSGIGLRQAFMPKHPDALTALLNGKMPTRNVSQSGSKIGSGARYAMLWLPPVDPNVLQQYGRVTCAHVDWADGSSSIDPPPELLDRLS